jgi:hypothetical protein
VLLPFVLIRSVLAWRSANKFLKEGVKGSFTIETAISDDLDHGFGLLLRVS